MVPVFVLSRLRAKPHEEIRSEVIDRGTMKRWLEVGSKKVISRGPTETRYQQTATRSSL